MIPELGQIALILAFIALLMLAYFGLPVSDLPAIDFPTISVCVNQPGASPETMANTVATPLEREFTSHLNTCEHCRQLHPSGSGGGARGVTLVMVDVVGFTRPPHVSADSKNQTAEALDDRRRETRATALWSCYCRSGSVVVTATA